MGNTSGHARLCALKKRVHQRPYYEISGGDNYAHSVPKLAEHHHEPTRGVLVTIVIEQCVVVLDIGGTEPVRVR